MKSPQTLQKERERERREKREEQKKKKKRGPAPLWLPEEIAAVEMRRDIEEKKNPPNQEILDTLDRQLAEARRQKP